jgi:S-adenosylmethionine:tRNA ribosyltransferase-isomerase
MHPKNISIADFRYALPQERIALYPLAERDGSKLLVYRQGQIREDIYRNLAHHLPENALLIFNDTKVVEARIVFRKPSGAQIEIFCLEPPTEYGSIATAMSQTGKIRWKCLIGGASKWKPGQVLCRRIEPEPPGAATHGGTDSLHGTPGNPTPALLLEARWIDKLEDCFLIELSWSPPELSFAELLHRAGLIPLPPYIRRAPAGSDQERYQTVYARYDGSVAAPTAGLHFTEALFKTLEAKNIRKEFVTLHVGAGTFMPVKTEVLAQHAMHAEFIVVKRPTIEKLLAAAEGTIIPVGTTSLRTIESLYWLGIKTIRNPAILPEDLVVHQWDPYTSETTNDRDGAAGHGSEDGAIGPGSGAGAGARNAAGTGMESIPVGDSPAGVALQALLDWMERHGLEQLQTKTQLLITPGYPWKLTRALITNFHQPESTLLLLVSALIGDSWKDIYRYALDHEFRFLSYGDGCLLYPL